MLNYSSYRLRVIVERTLRAQRAPRSRLRSEPRRGALWAGEGPATTREGRRRRVLRWVRAEWDLVSWESRHASSQGGTLPARAPSGAPGGAPRGGGGGATDDERVKT